MAGVLIADDEAAIRDVIASTCALDGWAARTAATAAQAVDAYLEDQPDLLILDLNMPGGGAEEILLGIERLRGEVDCPVILVSGFAVDPFEHPRVVAVIQKPFGIDAMRIAIKTALAG